jgi:hypothetical protein
VIYGGAASFALTPDAGCVAATIALPLGRTAA